MSGPAIVTENAERLARKGGVFNLPGTSGPWRVQTPFESEVWLPADLYGAKNVGTVTVTNVHHADDPQCGGSNGDPAESRLYEEWRCHPDAKPDCWHWTVEPIE